VHTNKDADGFILSINTALIDADKKYSVYR